MKKLHLQALFVFLTSATTLFGQAEGPYDLTYGTNGIAQLSYDDLDLYPEGMAIQPDGKIILVGFVANFMADTDAFMARLNVDGSLDETFANNGFFIYDYAYNYDNVFLRAQVRADGKIVAMGRHNWDNLDDLDPFVVQLNPDGSLDTAFGYNAGGSSDGSFESEVFFGSSIAPSGKIVMAGWNGLDADTQFPIICRWNKDGTSDSSYDGFIVELNAPDLIGGRALDALADEEGNVYACGFDGNNRLLIVKTNEDGSPNANFGTNGIMTIDPPVGATGNGYSMTISQSGDLLVCGSMDGAIYLAKLNSETGALISSFGNGGSVSIDPWGNGGVGLHVLELPDGQIVLTGSATNDYFFTFVVIKLNEDGSPNQDWGLNGIVFDNTSALATSSGVQPDGKIISCSRTSLFNFTTIRYLNQLLTSSSTDIIPAANSILLSPNPSNQHNINLEYELDNSSFIQITLYDQLGRLLGILLKENRPAGLNYETLNLPIGLSSGTYLINIQSDIGNSTQQLILR